MGIETSARSAGTLLLGGLIALAIAVPAFGQEASPAPTPVPSEQKPDKSPRPAKADKAPEVPVSLTGRVGRRTEADGSVTYTLTSGGTTFTLDAGPSWWWGASHPLAGLVGQSVSISGERREGATEIDVQVANGKQLREPGKPPWAGGWKVVGERHPGWTAEKAERWRLKWADGHPGLGRAKAPGQLKPKPAGDATP